MDLQQTHARFSTTNWTLIDALRDETHPRHADALDTLVQGDWPPVYASLRRMGRSRDVAAELTQAFFADVVLTRRLLDRAEVHRGKLRSLLLTAVKRYVIDQHRKAVTRADGHAVALDALRREDGFLAREPEQEVDRVFERRWAVAILEEALVRCERHFDQIGRPRHWAAFDAHVVQPAIHGSSPPALAGVAAELGFPSPAHVASATKVVRKRLRLLLREVVAETVVDADDAETEYRSVVSLLGP